jgi:hypothetical protein
MFARSTRAALLVGTFLGMVPATAFAVPVDGPPQTGAAPQHARDGGIIAGKIGNVDYQRNTIVVNKIEITIMPSTQIQGSDPGYHAFTDLKPGMSVEVYTSQVAGKYIAQIITLR